MLLCAKMKINYNAMTRHMLGSHAGDSICVFYELVRHYDLKRAHKVDNGYCIFQDSSISFPIDFLDGVAVEDIDVYMLLWKVVQTSECMRNMFLYILAMRPHPDCATFSIIVRIQKQIEDITITPPAIVDIFRCGRSDLQAVAASAVYFLLARLGSFEKVAAFMACASDSEWQVYMGSRFYHNLHYACVHAAIVCKDVSGTQLGSFCIDRKGKLLVCERDKNLLVLLLLFSDKFEYKNKSITECTKDGVPVQLSSLLRKQFPVVFKHGHVSTPRHFSQTERCDQSARRYSITNTYHGSRVS